MKRKWIVGPDEDLDQAFLECAAIAFRMGGTFSIAMARDEVGPDMFQHAGMSVWWDSYSPANRREPDEAEEYSDIADLEPEPEEVP